MMKNLNYRLLPRLGGRVGALCGAAALLFLLASGGAGAEVLVELSSERLFGDPREFAALLQAAPAPVAAGPGAAPTLLPKRDEPSDTVWIIPFFAVDISGAQASSTFWSVRNEGELAAASVAAEYFDTRFNFQAAQGFGLVPDQIASVDARSVAGLAIDGDGVARGFIRVTPGVGEAISVDAFQIDARNDFATGSPAFRFPADFCTNWQVRFLTFSGSDGSVLTVFVNGPRGLGGGNPPTVAGQVYNQQGAFINSFTLRTDEWAIQLPVRDLVEGNTGFGSLEIALNAAASPGGIVTVSHNAQGRFSVGTKGICKDFFNPG